MSENVISVKVVADTSPAKEQLSQLKESLKSFQSVNLDVNSGSIKEASKAAQELQKHLEVATNQNTGKLDLSAFQQSLQRSNSSLASLQQRLVSAGTEGRQAFLQLSSSIAAAEAPTSRMNAALLKFGQSIKNTISWQLSSSVIHGVMGAFSSAIGYAQDLNESLNKIRIVTGYSTEKMADFAKEANAAAKVLSTTTTKYTDASLIYYQQGLSDEDVKKRTDVTIKMANAAGQSVTEVSNQMTAVWNNFAKSGENLEHYADVMTALGAATASSTSEISQGLSKFASVADTVGLSYEYATSALATVTATTRQSADVVGTAFKTIFARLEGLKLGDTLDDGTSLNQYSQALYNVGINIKDASGNLKSMDNILDELGMKWTTLGKDQQVALAQTVAGTRQYTQLVALMDNWDFFNKNLSIANSSDGTLSKQADIYAESWEAARARAKAATEDLYDSLINDKAMIKFQNFFASITNGIAGFVDGLGGLKGLLLTVSSIFMSKFAKEMPVALQELSLGFQRLTGKDINKVSEMQLENERILTRMRSTATSEQERSQIDNTLIQNRMNNSLLNNQSRMSSREIEDYRVQIANIQAQGERVNTWAKTADELKASGDSEYEEAVGKGGLFSKLIEQGKQYYGLDFKTEREKLQSQEYREQKIEQIQEQRDSRIEAIKKTPIKVSGQKDSVGFENEEARNRAINNQIKIAEKAKLAVSSAIKTEIQNLDSMEDNSIDSKADILIQNYQEKVQKKIDEIDEQLKGLEPESAEYKKLKLQQDDLKEQQAAIKRGDYKKAYDPNAPGDDSFKNLQLRKRVEDSYRESYADAFRKQGYIQSAASTAKAYKTHLYDNQANYQALEEKQAGKGVEQAQNDAVDSLEKLKLNIEKGAGDTNEGQALIQKLNEKIEKIKNEAKTLDEVEETLKEALQEVQKETQTEGGSVGGVLSTVQQKAQGIHQQVTEVFGQETADAMANSQDIYINQGEQMAAVDRGNYDINRGGQGATHKGNNTSENLMKVAAAATSLVSAFNATQSALDALTSDTASIGQKFSSVLGLATTGLMSYNLVLSLAQKYQESLAVSASVLTGSIMGVTAILGAAVWLIDFFKKKKEEEEQAEAEKAKATSDQLQSTKELNKAYGDAVENYNKQKEAYDAGNISYADLQEAKQEAIEAGLEAAEEAGIAGVTGDLLNGNFDKVQKVIEESRAETLDARSSEIRDLETAKDNLEEKVTDEAKKKGITENKEAGTVEFSGGASLKDYGDKKATDILTSKDYNFKLTNTENGISLSNYDLSNADSVTELYDILSEAREDMLKQMTNDEVNGSEVYQGIDAWLNTMSEEVEAYKESRKELEDLEAEEVGLNNEYAGITASGIKDIKDYQNYKDAMVKEIAEAKGITEDSSAWEELENSVDNYLGELSNVTSGVNGDLKQTAKAIDERVEELTKAFDKEGVTYDKEEVRNELTELYETYGNDVFSLNLEAGLDPTSNESLQDQLTAQIDALQATANDNAIEVSVGMAKDYNLDSNSTTSEWSKFFSQMNDTKTINEDGTKSNESVFAKYARENGYSNLINEDGTINQLAWTAMSEESSSQVMSDFQSYANNERYRTGGTIDTEIANQKALAADYEKKAKTKKEVIDSKTNSSEWLAEGEEVESPLISGSIVDLVKQQKALEKLQKAQETNDLTSEQRTKMNKEAYASLREAGLIGENQTLDQSAVNQALDVINSYNEANEQLKETTDLANAATTSAKTLEEEKETYSKTGFRQALSAEAEQLGINYEETMQLAEAIRENDTGIQGLVNNEKDLNRESEEYALATQKVKKGITALSSAVSSYKKIIKQDNGSFTDPEAIKGIEAFQDALSNIIGKDAAQKFDGKKIKDNLDLIEKASKNDADAIAKLYRIAGEENLSDIIGEDPTGKLKSGLDGVMTAFDELVESGLKAGDTIAAIGEDGNLSTFSGKLASLAEQTNQTVSGMQDMFDSLGFEPIWEEVSINDVPAGSIVQQSGSIATVTADGTKKQVTVDGEVRMDPQLTSEGKIMVFKGAKYKGGGGGTKSKGGGGGGKKTQKKTSIDNRYHYNRQQNQDITNLKEAQGQKTEKLYGKAKIDSLKEELKLQKELIENQKQYLDEQASYIQQDKKMLDDYASIAGFKIEYDDMGRLSNATEVLGQINEQLAQMQKSGKDTTDLENLKQAITDYESTLNLMEETSQGIIDMYNEQIDKALELIKTEVEIKIKVSDKSLSLIDYQLGKIEDDAYAAAEAIALIGSQTGEYAKQAEVYRKELSAILDSRNLTVEDISNMTAEDFTAMFTSGEFDELEQIFDKLIDLSSKLDDQRVTALEKINALTDESNDRLNKQINLFDHYNTLLEDMNNISDLLGYKTTAEGRAMIEEISKATLQNKQNQLEASKRAYEEYKITSQQSKQTAQALKEQSIAAAQEYYRSAYGDTLNETQQAELDATIRQIENSYNDTIDKIDEHYRQMEEDFLNVWGETLQQAKDNFTLFIEDIIAKYEDEIAGLYGTLDSFKEIYESEKEVDNWYVDDYEKLYQLSKLNREIQKSIDDTPNIKNKQTLKKLMQEINELQASGVELSEYELGELEKRYELELARLALEEAKDEKNIVRFARDNEGNWGYVYTADEDAIDNAEQELEDKLYQYQKYVDDFFKDIQDKGVELQSQVPEKIDSIMNNVALSLEEKQEQLKYWGSKWHSTLEYYSSQMNKAFEDQASTLDRMLNTYKVSSADLVDTYEETIYSLTTGLLNPEDQVKSTDEWLQKTTNVIENAINESLAALKEYENAKEEINQTAGLEDGDTTEVLSTFAQGINEIKNASDATKLAVSGLAADMTEAFSDAWDAMSEFENKYLNSLEEMIKENEKYIDSIYKLLEMYAEVSGNDEVSKAKANYDKVTGWYATADQTEANQATYEAAKKEYYETIERVLGQAANRYAESASTFDTGGYTGEWGGEGRLAWLHEKELVLNAEDTKALLNVVDVIRQLDLQSNALSRGFGEMIAQSGILNQGVIEQTVTISASFPNATNHSEIEEAFNNLINEAAQYANRK